MGTGENGLRGRSRWVVLGVVAAAVIGAVALRGASGEKELAPTAAASAEAAPGAALPRLVDLGADKCIPCKMMAPILEELRAEYTGQFEVVFIDVWKDASQAQAYGVRVIPTQILYDASGTELMRHEGFFGKDDILAAWREHGHTFRAPATTPAGGS